MTDTGIYKIMNSQNNKCYVGSAISFKKRWQLHLKQLRENRHHSITLQRAWNKYGEETFSFDIVAAIDKPDNVSHRNFAKETLIPLEQYYINYFDSHKNGYNISPTAGSPLGVKHTMEMNAKKSIISRERQNRPEDIARRENIKNEIIKRVNNKQTVVKIIADMRINLRSVAKARKEINATRSDAQKFSYQKNPERASKISASLNEHYANPESREKLRQAQLKRYEDPAEREKVRNGLLKRHHTDERVKARAERDAMIREKLLSGIGVNKIRAETRIHDRYITAVRKQLVAEGLL